MYPRITKYTNFFAGGDATIKEWDCQTGQLLRESAPLKLAAQKEVKPIRKIFLFSLVRIPKNRFSFNFMICRMASCIWPHSATKWKRFSWWMRGIWQRSQKFLWTMCLFTRRISKDPFSKSSPGFIFVSLMKSKFWLFSEVASTESAAKLVPSRRSKLAQNCSNCWKTLQSRCPLRTRMSRTTMPSNISREK